MYITVSEQADSRCNHPSAIERAALKPDCLEYRRYRCYMHINDYLNFRRDLYRVNLPLRLSPTSGPAHTGRSSTASSLTAMEAASARYAARDRFGSFGEPAQTPLQRYIRMYDIPKHLSRGMSNVVTENAVDPQNFEPNLGLCLEIADLINSKKGNAYVSKTGP